MEDLGEEFDKIDENGGGQVRQHHDILSSVSNDDQDPLKPSYL